LRLVDRFLKTWPYNAHTTGSDALWSGLPESVTGLLENHLAMALPLASAPALMSSLRQRLVNHLVTALLFDSCLYARRYEAAFRQLVGQAPMSFGPLGLLNLREVQRG
jgi:protein O-GlcNAc transferase